MYFNFSVADRFSRRVGNNNIICLQKGFKKTTRKPEKRDPWVENLCGWYVLTGMAPDGDGRPLCCKQSTFSLLWYDPGRMEGWTWLTYNDLLFKYRRRRGNGGRAPRSLLQIRFGDMEEAPAARLDSSPVNGRSLESLWWKLHCGEV